MFQRVDAPNYVYIVQSSIPATGRVYETFAIEQFIPGLAGPRSRETITNQVEAHLSQLSEKTGLMYELVYWASPERAYGLYPEAIPQRG